MLKIRECIIEDHKGIYELNKTEMGYDYPIEKTRENKLASSTESVALLKKENR